MVEDGAFSHKIYYIPIFKEILNLEGHPKVTTWRVCICCFWSDLTRNRIYCVQDVWWKTFAMLRLATNHPKMCETCVPFTIIICVKLRTQMSTTPGRNCTFGRELPPLYTVQYSTVQYTVQYCTVQYTVQYSTVQYTVQYSTVQWGYMSSSPLTVSFPKLGPILPLHILA